MEALYARPYLWSFSVALLGSLLLTIVVRAAARRFGLVAKPRPDRWHQKPTALFGGIGIFGGFLVSYLSHRPTEARGGGLLAACSAGMFLLGLVDDRITLKPYAKLVGQIAFATAFTMFGLRLDWLSNPILDQGLTIFWLVGVTNALNLLDNIDGAAGGIAAIAGAYLVYFSHQAGHVAEAQIAAAFTGAVIGFLFFNFNPASIFMGDCGSLFLGFFLGGLSLTTAQVGARRNVVATLAVPVLLLLLPILDTTLVTISRRYHGRKVSQGGRDHTSHRLVALGMSERRATLTLWLIAAAAGGLSVLVKNSSEAIAIALLGVFAFGMIFFLVFLGRVRVYERIKTESEAHGRALLPTLADFSYKRRVFETLNDLALIVLCYYGAHLLRFDDRNFDSQVPDLVRVLPVVIVSQISVFLVLGLYRGVWRYTGVDDLALIVKAVTAGVALSTSAVLLLFDGVFRPRLAIIDWLLLLVGVAGSRISFRFLRSWLVQHRPIDGRRILIYGAGDGGELLLRELRNNRELGMIPVGFVDDDPQKTGRVIHGVPVIGSSDDIGKIVESERVEEVVLSTGKVELTRSERVANTCVEQGLVYRRMRIAFD